MSVHIGNKIKQVATQRGVRITEFAAQINTTRANVYSIFKRKTIDTGLLEKVARVLEHDFFQYYATALVEQNKILKDEIAKLKEDKAILKDVVDLLKEKNKAQSKSKKK